MMLTMSLKMTLKVHLCNEKIAMASLDFINNKPQGCGMDDGNDSCNFPQIEEKSCCSDFTAKISFDSDYSVLDSIINFDHFVGLLPSEVHNNYIQPEISSIINK